MHAAISRLLLHASREIQLLAALSPVNAGSERDRLAQELREGGHPRPRWAYAAVAHREVRVALEAARHALTVTEASPMTRATLERIRELQLEAELCSAAGTGDVGRLGRLRFAPPDASTVGEASTLSRAWLTEPARDDVDDPRALTASDDEDSRSLLMRMRAEVGRRRLPFSVVVHPSLAPIAATGDGVILVASGRPLRDEDVARTVLHEVEGHALPRVRAREATNPLLRAGTARGVDDQEGRALLLEDRHGLLGSRRRRQLAARHWAVEAMSDGATFPDVATLLVRKHGFDAFEAVVVGERVFRGGDGMSPGLGRERTYLESFVRVRAHLAAHPQDDGILAAGQVSIEAIPLFRALTSESKPAGTSPSFRTA